MLVPFFIAGTKCLMRNNLEGFFDPWFEKLQSIMVQKEQQQSQNRKQREGGRVRFEISRFTQLGDSILGARHHCKGSSIFQNSIASWGKKKIFQHMSLWEALHTQTITSEKERLFGGAIEILEKLSIYLVFQLFIYIYTYYIIYLHIYKWSSCYQTVYLKFVITVNLLFKRKAWLAF